VGLPPKNPPGFFGYVPGCLNPDFLIAYGYTNYCDPHLHVILSHFFNCQVLHGELVRDFCHPCLYCLTRCL